jgi:integrase
MLVGDLFHRHLEELHARVGLSPPNGISAGHYRDAARVLNDLATDPTYGIGGWTVKQLRTGGVERVGLLLGNRPNWGPATKRGYVSMIITAFRNQAKFIGSNPMEGLERPAAKPRDHFYTAEQVAAIIENANSEEFALFFNFLLHSGCRPSELCTLTAGDVQRKDGKLRLFLHHKNEKKTGGKRYVYLKHTWMQETIADLMQRRPKGPLFLNHIHCPWQENSLNAALRKTIRESEKCQALGLDDHDARFQIKRGKKEDFRVHHYVIYSARHTFAFRWLTGFFKDQKGNPIVLSLHEVAELMGNSAMMVEKVYGHIAKSGKLGEIVPV